MVFILAALGACCLIFALRRTVLLMPAWMLLTPKALLLIDIESLPVLSMYRFMCMVMLAMYIITVALANGGAVRKGPFFTALFLFLGTALVSVLVNFGGQNAGLLTWLALLLEIAIPVFVFCHFASRLSISEMTRLIKIYIAAYIAVCLYAIGAYLIGINPYIDFINTTTETGRVMARTYSDTLRGARAQGTVSHPITFGALIVLMLLTVYVVRLAGRFGVRKVVSIAMTSIVILTAALLTNSRSPLILFFVAVLAFGLSVGFVRSIKYVVLGLLLLAVLLSTSDLFLEKFLSVVNIFDSSVGVEQNGSDLAMRGGQFLVALGYFWQSPMWGHGLDATRMIVSSGSTSDLYDAESVLFKLMIDQGILGFIGFFGLLALVYRRVSAVLSGLLARRMYLGMSAGYTIFVVSTGVMDTLQLFLLLSGFIYYYGAAVSSEESSQVRMDVGELAGTKLGEPREIKSHE